MENTRNMKMTPVGLIPEDWDVATIKDYGHLLSDGINPQQYREKDFVEYSMPAYDDGQSPTKCKGADMNSNRTQIRGEVLLFNKLNVRQKRVWYIENAPSNALCSMEFLAFTSDRVDLRLLREILLQNSVTKGFESVSRGTSNSQKRIAPSDFLNFSFALPPLAEQHRIADALSSFDDMIVTLDKAITKKRQIKEGLMQQLLTGKTRLPEFYGEWLPKNLGKSALIKARIGWQGLTTKEYLDSGVYYLITGTDFKDGRIDWKNCHYVTRDRFEQDPYIKIQKHDVLVSKDGTIGKVAYLDDIPGPGTLNSGVFVIRSKDKQISQRYLAKVFVSKYFDDFIDSIVAGSTIVHLYQKDIVKFDFMVPPSIEEQEQVCDFLEGVDNEIISLESKRDKYASLKQGMMQELLTGKTRL